MKQFIIACLAMIPFNYLSIASTQQDYVEEQQYSQAFPLLNLPSELISQILSYKDINSILAVRASSKYLQHCSENKNIWDIKLKDILQEHFLESYLKEMVESYLKPSDWKLEEFGKQKSFFLDICTLHKIDGLWKSIKEKASKHQIFEESLILLLKPFLDIALQGELNSWDTYKQNALTVTLNTLSLLPNNPYLLFYDLFNCQFNDQSIQTVIHSLQHSPHLTYLSFSGNNITDEVMKDLGNMVKNHNKLRRLDLSNNNITDKGALIISEALKFNTSLKELKLLNNDIYEEGIVSLQAVVKEYRPDLKIAWNNIKDFTNNNYLVHQGDIIVEEWLNAPQESLKLSDDFLSTPGIENLISILSTSSQLYSLILDKMKFNTIDSSSVIQAITNNSYLTYLSLRNYPFTKESFKHLLTKESRPPLLVLNLNENSIINSNTLYIAQYLKNHTHINTLSLAFSNIDNKGLWILKNGLKSNSSLQRLYLSGNNFDIQEMENTLISTNNLEELSLRDNSLGSFPFENFHLQQLKALNLNKINLDHLPTSIGRLTKLEYLSLGRNKLLDLPDEICQLTSLQYLNLSENSILRLPTSLGNLYHLQVLDLEDNNITKLPEEFSKLQNLTYLDIRRNKLKYLPKNIGAISKLAKLYLYHNFELRNLPRSFTQLTNLEELKFENSYCSNLTFSVLIHLTQLNTKLMIFNNSVSDDIGKILGLRQL